MPSMLLLQSFVMGVVEGLTEFLPISSTGHLVVVGNWLAFNSEKGKVFEIVIQTGAILAVIWEYRVKLWSEVSGLPSERRSRRFAMNLAIAFIPAAMLGLAFEKGIKALLFAPVPVALAFIIGGVIILWAERRTHTVTMASVDDLTPFDAFKIGCAQCVALIPGASRSGATIIGGLLCGLSRKAATEFSFFLAVPTLMAAGGYELFKARALLSASDAGWFGVGLVTAFISALLCVRWLIRYISQHDFSAFAWYRIVVGIIVIAAVYVR